MNKKQCIVRLYNPVTIDGKEHYDITLRKPTAGDLRGKLSLDDLGTDMGVTAKIVERCSAYPNIPSSSVLRMELEDVMVLVAGFGSFFDGIDPLSRVNMKKEEVVPSGSTPTTPPKKQQQ